MTDTHFESVFSSVKNLVEHRNECADNHNYYVSNITNVIAPAVAMVEYIQSEAPQINRHYSEAEINEFTFDQAKRMIFSQPQHYQTMNPSFLDEMSMAAQGAVVDIINPTLSFVNGKGAALAAGVSSSLYGKKTAKIRGFVNKLKDNEAIVEALSIARIATTVGVTVFAGDYEVLPIPTWVKKTKTYNLANDSVKYIQPFIDSAREQDKSFLKLLNPKSSKIFNLVLAGVALKNGESLPCFYATAKIGYSAYVGYINNEAIRVIADENKHLKKYINAKNRVNAALAKNYKLKNILDLRVNDIITTNTDAQLANIYKNNPVLKNIFQPNKQEFKTEKDKIIFIQALNKLVKTNDGLKGIYKIWQTGETNISEKKLKIAAMHFSRHYKVQFNKYQKDRFAQVGNATMLSAYQKAIRSDFMKAFIDVLKLASGKVTSTAALSKSITSLVTAKAGKAFTEESKKNKVLAENSILRMDAPDYKIGVDGSYKHEIARIAFDKQVEAMALEIMVKMDLTQEGEQDIKKLYQLTKSHAKKQLLEDPLFSKSILSPTVATRAYGIGEGLLNSINPWGSKPSLPTVEEVKPAVIQQDKEETAKTSNNKFHKLLPVEIMQDIKKLSCYQSNDDMRGVSPTSVAMSASLETDSCNLSKISKVRRAGYPRTRN